MKTYTVHSHIGHPVTVPGSHYEVKDGYLIIYETIASTEIRDAETKRLISTAIHSANALFAAGSWTHVVTNRLNDRALRS